MLADRRSDRLFIADTNHNRVVVASADGLVRSIIGSGEPGLIDGAFEESRFDGPQGLELVGDDTLYVADAGNHAIRRVDLANRHVKTIAGTGQQAMAYHGGGIGAEVSLNSPWDLAAAGESLYIAMAGFHQLWRLDLATDEVSPFAGNGREGIVDGPLASAELAQPNGVAADGDRLYFADSETSSIRYVDLRSGTVNTIVGDGLFTFGDVDGVGDRVRLQHVQGVDVWDGRVYVSIPTTTRSSVFPRTSGGYSPLRERGRRAPGTATPASPSCTSRPGSARRMASSTWPTRTTTRSASSTRTPSRCRHWSSGSDEAAPFKLPLAPERNVKESARLCSDARSDIHRENICRID